MVFLRGTKRTLTRTTGRRRIMIVMIVITRIALDAVHRTGATAGPGHGAPSIRLSPTNPPNSTLNLRNSIELKWIKLTMRYDPFSVSHPFYPYLQLETAIFQNTHKTFPKKL